MIRIVLMPVRIRIWIGIQIEIRIQKHCFMQLTEQEFMWAILSIINKGFCKRDCNWCCVTLCHCLFQKKKITGCCRQLARPPSRKVNDIAHIYWSTKTIFFLKQLRYHVNRSFIASFFCLCATFKGDWKTRSEYRYKWSLNQLWK